MSFPESPGRQELCSPGLVFAIRSGDNLIIMQNATRLSRYHALSTRLHKEHSEMNMLIFCIPVSQGLESLEIGTGFEEGKEGTK